MVLSSCCSSIARVRPGSRDECSTAPGGRRPLDKADRLDDPIDEHCLLLKTDWSYLCTSSYSGLP